MEYFTIQNEAWNILIMQKESKNTKFELIVKDARSQGRQKKESDNNLTKKICFDHTGRFQSQ